MKNGLVLESFFILVICLQVKCDVFMDIDTAKRNCTFVFSNGDYDEFLTAFPLFENCTKQFSNAVLLIKLINYNLPAFPNGTFTNLPHLKSFTLQIFNGTQIQLLSPLLPQYFVFENLKFEKAMIDVSDSRNLNGWKWEALSGIKYENIRKFEFIAMKSKIIRLDPSFGKVANGQVTAIRILNCQLRWLGENVFGPLSNLTSLELRKNFLEKFERSHLPNDASKLKFLDLGNNRLQYISEALFRDLKLSKLFLDGNNIKILDHQMDSIIAADTVTFISGALWPCECSRLKGLSGRMHNLLEEECYKRDLSLKTIRIFLASCKI